MTDNLNIQCLKSQIDESGSITWWIFLHSLAPGQGINNWNLLRRVLLGNIGGTTITAIRIAGA